MAAGTLCSSSRALLLGLLGLSPLCLGRLLDWEALALLLVASLASLLWLLGGGRLLPRAPAAFDYLLLAGAALCAVVTSRSVYLYDSLVGLSLLYGGMLSFFLARGAFPDAGRRKVAWWCLVAGGVVAALWGAREYVTNAIVMGDSSWRAFGPFYNPNCLGGYMAMLLAVPPALAVAAQTRRPVSSSDLPEAEVSSRRGRKRRVSSLHRPVSGPPAAEAPRYAEIAGAMSALVLVLGLLCTGSKGAMLAAVASGLLVAAFGAPPGSALRRHLRLAAVAAVALAIVAALTFPPIRNRVLGAFSTQQHSGSFRVYTWQSTAKMALARPLTGFGPGTFAHVFPGYAQAGFTRQAHQTPLQFGAEYGLPAGLLLLCGIGWAVVAAVRGAAVLPTSERLLAVAGVGGVVALWVHNLVDYTWYVAGVNGVSWVMLGLAVAPAEAAGHGPEPGRGRTMTLAALMGILLLWSVVALHSEAQRTAAVSLARSGNAAAARAKLARVLPIDAYRWSELSKIEESLAAAARPGALRQAIEARRRAISLQPTEPTNYTALGRLLMEDGDAQAARQAMAGAVELHPTSTDALAALGRLLQEQGDRAAALDVYRRLVALHDTPVRLAQAVEYFVDRNYVYGWVPLAVEALEQGNREQGLQYASQAADLALQYVAGMELYRPILELSGRYDLRDIGEMEQYALDAAGLLRRVGTPVALLRAAWVLQALGKDSEAAGQFDAAATAAAEAHTVTKRAVKAAAELGRAQCLGAADGGAGETILAPALATARQVIAELGANGSTGEGEWQAQDTRRLQEAVQRTAAEVEADQ